MKETPKQARPPYTLAKNPNKVKVSLGEELELKFAPGKTWNVLKGEDVQEIEFRRKHELVDKKGVIIGEVVHKGLALIIPDPVIGITGKRYAVGDVKCTHKFTKNGKRYTIDGTESMKQEVAEPESGITQFTGVPDFFDLRIQNLTQDGEPQSAVSVKYQQRRWVIHFIPIHFTHEMGCL